VFARLRRALARALPEFGAGASLPKCAVVHRLRMRREERQNTRAPLLRPSAASTLTKTLGAISPLWACAAAGYSLIALLASFCHRAGVS